MKVLLVCSAGMSSALVAKALEKEANKVGIDMEVKECSTQAFEEEVKNGYIISLVAPQIRHRYDTLKEYATNQNVPCILIEPLSYTQLGGARLLEQIKKELGDNFK